MAYQLHGVGKMKQFITMASCILLSACAHENALLQSPQANNTDSIDQINSVLDEALLASSEPALTAIKPNPSPLQSSMV